jgi:hypothetical protein
MQKKESAGWEQFTGAFTQLGTKVSIFNRYIADGNVGLPNWEAPSHSYFSGLLLQSLDRNFDGFITRKITAAQTGLMFKIAVTRGSHFPACCRIHGPVSIRRE